MNRKLFRGAVLETVLLSLIAEAPEGGLHGYGVFLALRNRFGVLMGSSTLYPELQALEQRGLLESHWRIVGGKARKQFQITSKGRRLLSENFAELKVVIPAVTGPVR